MDHESDSIQHAELKVDRMMADIQFGPFRQKKVDVCPEVADWEAHMLNDDAQNIHARIYKSSSAKLAVVVFRGTQMTSMKNWEVDANMGTVPVKLGNDGPEAAVHQGFKNELDRVLPRVKKWVAGYMFHLFGGVSTEYRLIFAGHSLGGALALLAATMAEAEGWSRRPDATVIFGAPRVADGVLDKWWQSRGLCSKLLRINIHNDVVHWMPSKKSMDLVNVEEGFVSCLKDTKTCLTKSLTQKPTSSDSLFSEAWSHVCSESEVLVAGAARGVNAELQDYSLLGGLLSHFSVNCHYGYAYGINRGSIATKDTICGTGLGICAEPTHQQSTDGIYE
jgi:hypothetical protein